MDKNVVLLTEDLQAVAVPVVHHPIYESIDPQSEDDTLSMLNAFLKQISDQGGEIVGQLQIPVSMPEQGGMTGKPVEERTFLIVKVRGAYGSE